jgi:hypothetical protein
MSDSSDSGYEVGYGRPPKNTRFQKGKSGNPAGRGTKKPPDPIDMAAILDHLENEEVIVRDKGTSKKMRKIELRLRRLFDKAIKGDLKAARLLMEMAATCASPDPDRKYNFDVISDVDALARYGRNWPKKVNELNLLNGFKV